MLHNKPNLIHWTPFTSQFSQYNFFYPTLVILKWTGVHFIDKKDDVTWKPDVHSWIQHFVHSYSDLFTQKSCKQACMVIQTLIKSNLKELILSHELESFLKWLNKKSGGWLIIIIWISDVMWCSLKTLCCYGHGRTVTCICCD